MTDEVPDEVRRLAEDRDAARRAKDYATADALRERIKEAGYEVTDAAEGPVLSPATLSLPSGSPSRSREPTRPLRAAEVVSLLDQSPAFDVSMHWLVQGWPEDVLRGIESFDANSGGRRIQHVVVDLTGNDSVVWPVRSEIMRLEAGTGWGKARNAGLIRSLGRIVVVADGSVEATGDALGPLIDALADPDVGVTGPFGIVTEDLHHFHESDGPDVDAIEGYLMAVRRDLLLGGLRFDEKFKFYRTADIELSFQVKATGFRATVTPVAVTRHEHRMWANTSEAERERLSKRNYYRFLDLWRGRTDLTVAGRPRPSPAGEGSPG